MSGGESRQEPDLRTVIAEAERLLKDITPPPWAWEWIAEKSNEWAVGQAWGADGKPIEGELPADEWLEDTIIERRLVGMNESGHASASDAEFIAAAPRLVRELLAFLASPSAARPERETPDWTVDAEGFSNSSAAFEDVVAHVADLMRSHRLGGDVEQTARLIVAQLAHVKKLTPVSAPSAAVAWQPIATCPKSGADVYVLLWMPGVRVTEGYWDCRSKRWEFSHGDQTWAFTPTHWMPLPLPPIPSSKEKE